jgi:hypothetical protein
MLMLGFPFVGRTGTERNTRPVNLVVVSEQSDHSYDTSRKRKEVYTLLNRYWKMRDQRNGIQDLFRQDVHVVR